MFLLIWVICAALLVLSVYIYINRSKNEKYLKNLPGPKPNFFLGNIDLVLFIPIEMFAEFVECIGRTYGKLIKLYPGPVTMAVLSSDAKFNEFILSSTKIIDKSIFYGFLHAWLGTGLLTSTGKKWKNRRRIITPTFHFSILQSYVSIFESVGDTFVKKLEKCVAVKSFDVFPLVTLCTLDIICETAMGTKLNALNNESPEYVHSVKTMCDIFIARLLTPLHPWIYILTPNYYREQKALKILHTYTENIIDKRIAEMSTKDETSETEIPEKKEKLAFLDLLLKIAKDDGAYLSRNDIREEVDTFMFEGHDTTATAISFALYCLSTNPDAQEKAYEEQKHIFKTNLKNVRPTMTDLQEMKYLDKVIKETLRLYPPVPILGRTTPSEEIVWDGHVFPKNIQIIISLWASHRDPDYFKDPLTFNPDRFDDENRPNSYVYTPFSAGPRNCIGQKFAMLEMKSVISKVIRHYNVLPANPVHKIKILANVVLSSLNGIRIALEKRDD